MAAVLAETFVVAFDDIKETFPQAIRSVVFSNPSGQAQNQVTGQITPAPTDTVECLQSTYKLDEIDGSLIQRGDVKLYAKVSDFSNVIPRVGIKAVINGVAHLIKAADQDPLGAVFVIQARRG